MRQKNMADYELPNYNEEMMARLLFCFETTPNATATYPAHRTP